MIPYSNNPYFVFVESNTSGTGYEFIRRASQKGYRPVLVSENASRYDLSGISADIVGADTADTASVLNVCRELSEKAPVAGVMSTSEYYVKIAAEVAEALLLPGPSSCAVEACRDKSAQRMAMLECGLACPRHAVITNANGLDQISLRFPVVIKPVSGSGSVGVKFCSNAVLLEEAVNTYFDNGHKNERNIDSGRVLLVEEYIRGSEYSAEVFGRKILGFTAKHLGPLPYFVETGHDFAIELPEKMRNRAEKAILSLCDQMGLDFGAKHVEFRIYDDEIYIIEVNPRLAGGHIPTVMEYAFGEKKLIDQIIDVYAGIRTDIDPTSIICPVSIRFIIPPHDGVLRKAAIRDGIDKDSLLETRMYKRCGDYVSLHGDFRDRIGHIIFKTGKLPAGGKIEDIFDLTVE